VLRARPSRPDEGFHVLDKTCTPDRKVRYIQFGDKCETFDEAVKPTKFPNLRDPIIVNREEVEEIK
jgi:hypothetical protein